MNKWSNVFFGFLFVVVALSVISFIFNVVVGLAIFALKLFVYFSIGFFAFKWTKGLLQKKEPNA